jgi:farnesyl-diphosphate farnesyltransferase
MFDRILYYSGNPLELSFLLQMKKQFKEFRPSDNSLEVIGQRTSDTEFCSEALKKVSRSFSVVIHQLPKEIQAPVGLFYLILRGLDTVEDDMSIEQSVKTDLLNDFASRMNREAFTLSNIGDTQDYKDLMANFDKVIREYQKLDTQYKEVITDITDRMAFGMNKYVLGTVDSYEDWNDYCHYVAGLVGIGLSKLFIASGIEKDEKLKNEELSNEMGLFLQKTNIIRDFAEDLDQTRVFWPSVAWNDKVKTLHELQTNKQIGVEVINELVTNALNHIPACLNYLESIKNEKVFRFCAIPQLMAIATLNELYGNEKVLTENVKIRKGKTARFFMSKQNFKHVKAEFLAILNSIYKKDKNPAIHQLIQKING